jgi:response regulator RpfG family c-di-GMP phosphodiesterase
MMPDPEVVHILVVEDSPTQAAQLCHMLEQKGYRVSRAANGKEAMKRLRKRRPAVVITDVMMPEMDGFELCRTVREDDELADLPIILLTSASDPQDVIRGLEVGADCFFTKPADDKELVARILSIIIDPMRLQLDDDNKSFEVVFGNDRHVITSNRQRMVSLLLSTFENTVKQQQALTRARRDMQQLMRQVATLKREQAVAERGGNVASVGADDEALRASLSLVSALAGLVEVNDPQAVPHQQKVAKLARAMAERMGLTPDQIHGVEIAGAIHDIGKLYVPGIILAKLGKLTSSEHERVKAHARAGHDVVKDLDLPWPVADTILQHHERLDGSGYPEGLTREKIILEARILAVADVVTAMCEDRPHRPAHGIQTALDEVGKFKNILYDPSVTDACIDLFYKQEFRFDEG